MPIQSRFILIAGGFVFTLGCRNDASAPASIATAGATGVAGSAVGGSVATTAGAGGAPGSAGTTSVGGGGAGGGQAVSPLALSVGPFSACVVGSDQLVKCAGRCGPSGHGGSRDQAPPGLRGRGVAVGREFACALLATPTSTGDVQCWGAGAAAEAPNLPDIVEVVAGDVHACARNREGVVTCWGDAMHSVPDGVSAKALAASGAMTCAIVSDATVRCWGPNPVSPPPELHATQLAVSGQLADPLHGPRFGCVIALDGSVRCFGDDVGGVLTPPAGLMANRVAVGRSNACAIGMDDQVTCWGAAPRSGVSLPARLKATALALAFRDAGALDLSGKFVFWGDSANERGGL